MLRRFLNSDFAHRICPITTYRHRRESIGLLFNELAVCVRHNYPLPEALEKIAKGNGIPWQGVNLFRRLLKVCLYVLLGLCVFTVVGKYIFHTLAPWKAIIGAWIDVFFALLIIYILDFHHDFLRHVALGLSYEMKNGKSLYEAMVAKKKYFEPFELALIRVGERSGKLDDALKKVAHYNTLANRSPWTPYLFIYPFITVAISGLLFFFITLKLMPKFEAIFAQLGARLPHLTLQLISMVNFFTSTFFGVCLTFLLFIIVAYFLTRYTLESFFLSGWIWGTIIIAIATMMLIGMTLFVILVVGDGNFTYIWGKSLYQLALTIVLIALGVCIALREIRGIRGSWLSSVILSLPGLRRWYEPIYHSRFLYALGSLLSGGETLPDALRIAGAASGHKQTRREADALAGDVAKGISLQNALNGSNILTPSLRCYLRLAASSQRLEETCQQLSEELLQKVSIYGERARAYVRVFVIIILGIFVGAVALALYLPYFQIPVSLISYTD